MEASRPFSRINLRQIRAPVWLPRFFHPRSRFAVGVARSRCAGGGRHSFVAHSSSAVHTPRLVFDRYADQYFLREIRLPGKVGFEFPRTAAENAAAERLASGAKPDVVVVRVGQ
jgi:hypothetical protein